MSISVRNRKANGLILLLAAYILAVNPLFGQAECCKIPSCNPDSETFANLFSDALDKIGQYPDTEPDIFIKNEDGKNVLNPSISTTDKILYEAVICWTSKLKTQDPVKADEILSFIDSEDQLNWWNYFNSFQTGNTSLPSPNFARGTYWVLNLRPLGAISPYGTNEGYMGSYDILIGRTIKRRDPLKDRRLRLSLGMRYQRLLKQDDLLAISSLDWKLTDIQFNAFNLGSLKMHFQGFINEEIVGGETGIGFETYGFGVNLISIGYQDYDFGDGIYLQSGFALHPSEFFKLIK